MVLGADDSYPPYVDIRAGFGPTGRRSRRQAVGRSLHHHRRSQHTRRRPRRLRSGGVWRGRLALLGRHGAAIPVDGAIASFTLPSGEPGGFVGTLRNVTQEEHLRAELQRSERLRAVGTLAAGIAHDFNNLLTPIIGGTELIAATDDEARRARHLQSIREAALRAAELVEEIRLFSLERESEPERFDLREIVAEAIELIDPMCSDQITIECELGHDPVVVERFRPSCTNS